jgi:hypothetical protein
MNQHVCKDCEISFTRKDTLEKHMLTIRHKKNANKNTSIKTTNIKEEIVTSNKTNNDIEMLKKQLEMQTNLISKLLKANEPFSVDTYLNETCKDAPNFEDLFQLEEPYMYNKKMNKWIEIGGSDWDIFPVVKYIEVGYYPKTVDFTSDMFCSVLNKMEHTKKPIYCVNDKSGIYRYKTNDEWQEIDYKSLTKRIYNWVQGFMNRLLINTRKFASEYPVEFLKLYGKDKNFYMRNSAELGMTCWLSMELEPFTKVCHKKLAQITSQEKAEFQESVPHHWNEYKDIVNYDTESDEE